MNEIQQRQIIAKGVSDSSRYSGGDGGDGLTLAIAFIFLLGHIIYQGLSK